MNGLRDHHNKGSKSDRERQIPYGIVYTWNLKNDTNGLVYKTETELTHSGNKLMVTRKEGWERDHLGVWD